MGEPLKKVFSSVISCNCYCTLFENGNEMSYGSIAIKMPTNNFFVNKFYKVSIFFTLNIDFCVSLRVAENKGNKGVHHHFASIFGTGRFFLKYLLIAT
jgi:hypothetical protein